MSEEGPPPGVNILGFISLEAGLAAACRMNMAAIRAAGHATVENDYPVCLFQGGCRIVYDTNYLHFHPDHWTLPANLLEELMKHRRNIAYWAWETDRAPDSYREFSKRLHAVWVPSTYVAAALGEMHCPVHVLPHAVQKPRRRAAKGRSGKFRVLYSFDGKSRVERKNPWATIRAFQIAFDRMDEAELVIKAHSLPPEVREGLATVCAMDSRVKLMEQWIGADELTELYWKTNVFLGLQRSEGFGLHLAEAMAHGCVVITTGYGGHTDFIKDGFNGYLVPFKKVAITDAYYRGAEWAEPDVHAAAEKLTWVYDMWNGPAVESIRFNASRITQTHSPQVLQARIAELLQ
jgi:glycosyltransferase involved in cell wall biosynthesis